MRIYYKGVLCNLATYRVMGEDRPALYPVDFSEEEIFIENLMRFIMVCGLKYYQMKNIRK